MAMLGLAGLGASPSPHGLRPATASAELRPDRLGDVARIVRYSVAQPDRSQTAFLFLSPSADRGSLPEEVQVVGLGGERLHLSNTEGADCTLEHVWVRQAGSAGPEVVYAARVFSGDLKTDVVSEPAPMAVSVFRPHRGEQPGDSAVVLKIVGPPRRTRPVCLAADVQREMARLAGSTAGARK